MKDYFAEAKGWLAIARQKSCNGEVKLEIQYLREYVRKAGCSLEDIGTSEEELKSLRAKGYRSEAQKRLDLVRSHANLHGEVEDRIRIFREYAKKARYSLEDVGTSEEELSDLLVIGYKTEAKKWLGFARKIQGPCQDGRDIRRDIEIFREYVRKAGCPLEDIGTSEEELKELLKKGKA